VTLTVVLTREPPRNDVLRDSLADVARVREVPVTTTTYLAPDAVERAVASVAVGGAFGTIVATSARAATFVTAAARYAVADYDLGAIGATTTAALRAEGVASDRRVLVPERPSGRDLGLMIERGPVLILGAAEMRDELAATLAERSLVSHHVPCYRTSPVQLTRRQRHYLHAGDIVVIAAPSAWRVASREVRADAVVVAIGGTTAHEVEREHTKVVVASPENLADVVREVAVNLATTETGTSD